MKKVLVIATHPDDETLGCGGTLLKHVSCGDSVSWLICTDISQDHAYFVQREDEIKKVGDRYGFSNIYKLGLKTTAVDEYSSKYLVDKLSAIIAEVQPNVLYIPFVGDVHSDHRVVFDAVLSCTKSFRHPYIKEVYMMETLSETEYAVSCKSGVFSPNVFVDISNFMEKKIEIMKVYESELSSHPFPRSIKNMHALAILRGSTAGCEYAESFMLVKHIS